MRILAILLALAATPGPGDGPPSKTSDDAQALPKPSKPSGGDPGPIEAWDLGLRDAIRIGLDNSEQIRVIRFHEFGPTTPDNVADRFDHPARPGGDFAIAPTRPDMSIWEFQALAMARVRSIERQYWSLWRRQVAFKALDDAFQEARELLKAERAEIDEFGSRNGGVEALPEAERRSEGIQLDDVAATSDLLAAERQLRDLLGLPEADNHRLVAVTPPTEAQVAPDWDSCVAEMDASQPDIAQQAVIVHLATLHLLDARNQLLPIMSWSDLDQFVSLGDRLDELAPSLSGGIRASATRPGPNFLDPSRPVEADFTRWQVGMVRPITTVIGWGRLSNSRQAHYQLLRRRAAHQQVVHQSTDILAQTIQEVDATYQKFATARRLEVAASRRLETDRAFHEEGRLTLGRLLDDLDRRARAVAEEARCVADYNASLATLEEAKGTILASHEVAIAERPSPREAYVQAKGRRVAADVPELPAGPGR